MGDSYGNMQGVSEVKNMKNDEDVFSCNYNNTRLRRLSLLILFVAIPLAYAVTGTWHSSREVWRWSNRTALHQCYNVHLDWYHVSMLKGLWNAGLFGEYDLCLRLMRLLFKFDHPGLAILSLQ